jgi:hypothetical protein
MNDLIGKRLEFEADNLPGPIYGYVVSYDSAAGVFAICHWNVICQVFEQNIFAIERKGKFVPFSPTFQIGREV